MNRAYLPIIYFALISTPVVCMLYMHPVLPPNDVMFGWHMYPCIP